MQLSRFPLKLRSSFCSVGSTLPFPEPACVPQNIRGKVRKFHTPKLTAGAYSLRMVSLSSWPLVQRRGVRTKPQPPRIPLPQDEPTEDERLMFQRMLEQRQINILQVAREKHWFFPSELTHPPAGWSYEWSDWVAGWELVPIVHRSQIDLVLEHYFGMPGKFTPVIFQQDPFAPDFIFRYEGMDTEEEQRKGITRFDQGKPGAYYYFHMGDDEVFMLPSEFDGFSPEEFLRAQPSFGLQRMMNELAVVPALPDGDKSTHTFMEECDNELIQFEERLAVLESEGKERPDTVMALRADGITEEPLHPLTKEKIQALRERYESYKSYGVYTVYSLAGANATTLKTGKQSERRKRQSRYLEEVDDFEGRVGELKKELHEITDDEGEFEVVKPQSRGRQRRNKASKERKHTVA